MPIKLPTSRLFRISMLLALFFAADKVLAVLRQVLTARLFGLSAELDAFNAANNLPDLIFALISGGALAIAFIPVLTEELTTKGNKPAWLLFSRVANLAFVVTAVLAVLVALFAEPLVSWRLGIAPGFNESQRNLVAELMRLNLAATLIFSISGLVMAGLMANQHFLLPAVAPLFYNLGQIFGVVILAPDEGLRLGSITFPAFGLGVHGLVYGVLFGALLHLLIQIPGLIRYKFQWTMQFGIKSPEVVKVLKLLGPRLMTMFFIQLIFIARDNLASRLTLGAVSALTYGWMIMQVPETLIGTAIGTALLPTLSEQAARGDWITFKTTIDKAVRALVALTVPAAVVVGLGVRPFLGLAFHFDEEGIRLLNTVTQMYLLGLVAHSLIEVGARAFYSRQDARIPLFASGVALVTFVSLGAWLSTGGAGGLAAANSLAFTVEMLLLFFLLARKTGQHYTLQNTILRTIGAALTAAVILLSGQSLIPRASLIVSAALILAAITAVIPFIWTELRLLLKL